MLNQTTSNELPGVSFKSLLLVSAIVLGSAMGHFQPSVGEWLGGLVDYTLLGLVGLLFFGVRFSALRELGRHSVGFLAIALLANFILVPFLGYGIASLFLSAHPLFMVGIVIYFMSPCTDWFLSFTKLSGGNVALGTALIPINMITQLLLYPVYLELFTSNVVQIETATVSGSLWQWFLLPLIMAILARQILAKVLTSTQFEAIVKIADEATLWVTSLLVLQIFAGNISVLENHLSVFIWALLAVFVFFLLTWLLGEVLSHLFKLHYPEYALLTMTIASRNAPMMLAITVAVLPNQPIIYAALVMGMLIEFPHLTLLRRLLLRTHKGLSNTPSTTVS